MVSLGRSDAAIHCTALLNDADSMDDDEEEKGNESDSDENIVLGKEGMSRGSGAGDGGVNDIRSSVANDLCKSGDEFFLAGQYNEAQVCFLCCHLTR